MLNASRTKPGMPKSSAKQLMCELPVKPKAVHIKIVDLHLNGPFFLLPLWEHFILTGLKGLLGLLLNKPFMITGHFQLWEKNTEVRFSLNLLRTWHFCDVCSSFYSSQNHNFFFFFSRPERLCRASSKAQKWSSLQFSTTTNFRNENWDSGTVLNNQRQGFTLLELFFFIVLLFKGRSKSNISLQHRL